MEIVCPACAKKNEARDACVRCGCDFSALRLIREGAKRELLQAKADLRSGRWSSAFQRAERSCTLAHSPESARVASCAAAGLGDFSALAQWRRRATDSESY